MTNTAYLGGSTGVILRFRAFVAATGLPKTDLAYNTASIGAKYTRLGAAATSITLATATAGTWATGGLIASNAAAGEYELHAPNAALLAGADRCDFVVWDGAGSPAYVCTAMTIEITGANPRSATTDANITKINGTTVIGAGTSGDKWRA